MVYRREIDGLRAVSVLSVILYHADLHVFRGGFVGVDIFFVISGYLITTILLGELKTGTFSLAKFYERRARRILPALFVVAFACVPFAWLWLVPVDLESFSRSLIAVSAFASNVLFYESTAYFEAAAEWKPLLHTWSLAVEEQYYLVFPLLLLVAWRLGRRWVPAILVAVALASLAVARRTSVSDPPAAFYLLPARGWELLSGALVALHVTSGGRWTGRRPSALVRQICALLGLLLIAYAVVMFDKKMPYPSLYTLVPIGGAALIILFARGQTWAGKLLGGRALVSVGLMSYGAYLWHWPLFVFARHKSVPRVPDTALMAALSVAALVLAYLSWRYVERPFRSRRKVSRRRIFAFAALGSTVLVASGLVGHFTRGNSGRIADATFQPDIEFLCRETGGCMYQPAGDLPVGQRGLDCWLGDKTSPKEVTKTGIVLGDSYGASYDGVWDAVGKSAKLRINSVTTNWCMPTRNDDWVGGGNKFLQQCLLDRRYFAENVSKYDVAILGGNWADYLASNRLGSVLDLIAFAASRTKLVVVMAAPKQFDVNPVEAYHKALLAKKPFDIRQIPVTVDAGEARANRLLEEASRRYKNVLYIDRESMFNVDGIPSDVTRDNVPFTLEGAHVSVYGSKAAGAAFVKSKKYQELVTRLGL
jgi:peptidoglycan/LPS O-acetylase OafA/YrhL